MKKAIVLAAAMAFAAITPAAMKAAYEPTPEVRASQQAFAADRFGIFIHWGIYSMMGQGEWYLNYGPLAEEYAKAARGFYPAEFDARAWAKAIKGSGARYVCFTTRHHDGFSMWHTAESPYNIVDGTPFGRDVLKELADALAEQELPLHLYYSHIDWTRPDYPSGRTGLKTGRDTTLRDWPAYYAFMNRQLRELLTQYGPIRAVWFDGWWDHDEDATPFNWELPEQYAMVHALQPGCMVGNNHHQEPFEGEDIQIFERDVPGQNTAGLSGQNISQLPLETCQTMNGMWGYRVVDTNYKDLPTLIRLLVNTSGMGANLLLNVGPQPSGEIPAVALERLEQMGEWLGKYGETIYSTSGSDFAACDWGTTTRLPGRVFVHITDIPADRVVELPRKYKVKKAHTYAGRVPVDVKRSGDGLKLKLPAEPVADEELDLIVELEIDE